MKHGGEINVSVKDTPNDEPNSLALDERPVGNVSIASVTNTAKTVATTPQADLCLTTTSLITDVSSIPSMKSISLDYFLWLVNRLSERTTVSSYYIRCNIHHHDFGFERKDNLIVSEIVITKPEGLLDPCKCGKCACKNVCPCKMARVSCCKYCKCKADENCKKSNNRMKPKDNGQKINFYHIEDDPH